LSNPSGIGFVFQDVGIQLSGITGTVEEEIAFSLEQFGVPPAVIKERIEEQLALFQLRPFRNRHPESLSGGEAQLLAIASEAAKHPNIFILDEPAQGLDAKNIRLLTAAIRSWKKSAAVIITEEQINLTYSVGDRILFLEHGSPRFFGSLTEMLNSHIDFSSLDLPEWVDAQRLLERPTISASYKQSVKWLKNLRTSG
jgi:energy-coupling factor transporter ATP-binding protein EcfA2